MARKSEEEKKAELTRIIEKQMAEKQRELEAKGLKPAFILPAGCSDGELLRALVRHLKTGKTQGLNGSLEDDQN